MEKSELQYNDEVKYILDKRYEDYKGNQVAMISEEESHEEILQLFLAKDDSTRIN
ncbi:hypothetical protein [Mucilaginibacter jinjuensis]|uniref:Uncharacterized protein n=1 Tax=Mucilaginibacter jinjuensis TaxID=1176721 RepID=A0ABY7T609_9SPHI|nr:hypothetical protein [Mucilaginibacter jinjuensis]WCT11807.1 hypothetical protein PQO05_24045 [Mucilaginibacter jinjuensis]